MRRVPRMLSEVVKTKRHRPERSGDSRGFGVGFSFSSASTWLRTVPCNFLSRPCRASRASAMSLIRGPAHPSLRNSSSLASQTSQRSTSPSTLDASVAWSRGVHLLGVGAARKDSALLPIAARRRRAVRMLLNFVPACCDLPHRTAKKSRVFAQLAACKTLAICFPTFSV